MATATTATKAAKSKAAKTKATYRGSREAGGVAPRPVPAKREGDAATSAGGPARSRPRGWRGRPEREGGGAKPKTLAGITQFNMTWAGMADLTIIVTDRSCEADLLAARCWLRKWDRAELSFKDVVVYTPPRDWEPDDFLC